MQTATTECEADAIKRTMLGMGLEPVTIHLQSGVWLICRNWREAQQAMTLLE